MESPSLRLHAAAAVCGRPRSSSASVAKIFARQKIWELDLKHIVQSLGAELDVALINQALVDSWQQQQIADGYCPATIVRRHACLMRILLSAYKSGATKQEPRLDRSQALREHMWQATLERFRKKREARKLQQAR